MRVIYLPGGDQFPEIRDVPNELEALQELVGGYIEPVPMRVMISADIRLLVNDEGRMQGLKPNRFATAWYSGVINQYLSSYDPRVIVGPAVGVGVDGDEFTDVSDYQMHFISAMTVIPWSEERDRDV